jgi:hypothetical protein
MNHDAYDPFNAHGSDKAHPGRYGIYRLKSYRKREVVDWGGKSPKTVICLSPIKREFCPSHLQKCSGLTNWLLYNVSVNDMGVLAVYPFDGTPPIPATHDQVKVHTYWEDDEN